MNYIIIGMPSAGKTTLGKMLAEKLNREYLDLDDLIVDETGMSIPEIFDQEGEVGFRKRETEACKNVASFNNYVISTGGGVIKNQENINYLKANGVIFFIDRALEYLISNDPSRPLSSSKEAVEKMYEERYPLYNLYCDYRISNNGDINDTLELMLECIY